MKIAFILSTGMCVSPFNGIRTQAETWAQELERQGHEVNRVNPWDQQDWEKFDVIHLSGYSSVINNLRGIPNKRIMFSPIIDSFEPIWKYKLATHWGCKRLRLMSHNYEIRMASPFIAQWCVRTQFEYNYVNKALGVPGEKICLIPLSYRIEPAETYPEKEAFCLHVSKISDGRKNVERLVDAAIKYDFRLVLAGSHSPSFEKSTLKKKIDRHDNVSYLGRVTDKELIDLYKSAKVFALPSIGEGVGLVALEAAACGCDIVVTEIGGPKEYYDDKAFVVNPYKTEEIGRAVTEALCSHERQPALMEMIKVKYSLAQCVKQLVDWYKML